MENSYPSVPDQTTPDALDRQLSRELRRDIVTDLSNLEKSVLTLLVQGIHPQAMAGLLHRDMTAIYGATRCLRCRFATRSVAGIVSHAIQWGVIRSDGTFIPLDEV